MSEITLGAVESRFADIIWNNEPISSSELCKLTSEQLEWKKSTTFTVLKRLCEKGIFKNEKGTVSSLINKKEFYSMQSEQFVEQTFNGSLPEFLAAFTQKRSLTPTEVSELKKLIDKYGGK